MQYLKPTFTLPAAPSKVTQEEWDRIFGEQPQDTTFGQLLSNDNNSDATGTY